jgi:putative Ig domain-containing protein
MRSLLAACLVAGLVLLGCTMGRAELEFMPSEIQPALVGQPYLAAISVERNETPVGDMWVSSGALPPGLELTFEDGTDTGEIAGTPTLEGSYTFTVEVWCFGTNVGGQTGSASYTLVVN